jgi:hypothetical protein
VWRGRRSLALVNARKRPRTAAALLVSVVALAMSKAGCGSNGRPSGPPGTPLGPGGDGAGGVDAAGAPAAGGDGDGPLPPGSPLPGRPCNGNDAYCELPYDRVCFAATHDSAASSAQYWLHPTQDQTLREQLNGGIRALILEVHDDGGVATVCRGDCDEGNSPLGVVLADVATFFDENPRDVLTLLIDGELPAASLEQALSARGLDALALPHAADEPWPTLGDMIDTGRRLVVLADTPDAGPAWLLPRRELLWETAADYPTLSAMNCNPVVGDASRPLYLVHHNLLPGEGGDRAGTGAGGEAGASAGMSTGRAAEANQFGIVTERLERCRAQHVRSPSFVAVDFSRVGDVVGATQVMNGVRER